MKIYSINLKNRPLEFIYKVPRTFSFYKNNQVIYRCKDVYHLISVDGYVYTFGYGFNWNMLSNCKIPFEDFDMCYIQSQYEESYLQFKNFIHNCKKTKNGKSFNEYCRIFAKRQKSTANRTKYRDNIDFLMEYYYFKKNYYIEEMLCLDEKSDQYLRINFRTRERGGK